MSSLTRGIQRVFKEAMKPLTPKAPDMSGVERAINDATAAQRAAAQSNPVPDLAAAAEEAARKKEEERRAGLRNQSRTVLTSGLGDVEDAPVKKKTLLGAG